jgi:hypothetical protein
MEIRQIGGRTGSESDIHPPFCGYFPQILALNSQ